LPAVRAVHASLVLAALLLLVARAKAAPAAAAPAPVEVRPGSVVRWPGSSVTRCAFSGRAFSPLDDACYFAVDLLATGVVPVERTKAGKRERRELRVGAYPYAEQHVEIADQSKADLSPQDLARAEREEKEVARLFGLDTPRRFGLPLSAPLASLP